MVRKLILTRDDSADRVIDAINTSKESALTVVAPRGSALADREGLARVGELAAERGIAVAIESVDEELLALAHAAHLETVHPFFRADKRHLSLDGIVQQEPTKHTTRHASFPTHAKKKIEPEIEDNNVVIVQDDDSADTLEEPIRPHNHPMPTPVTARPSYEAEEPIRTEQTVSQQKPRRRLTTTRMIIAGVLIAAIVFGIGEGFFRHATVSVTLAETPWEYTGTIMAATSISTSTGNNMAIRGQLFEPPGAVNVAQPFPATGEPGATSSAPSGTKPHVTVFNGSLGAENFVVKTRFQGKAGIFRAVTAVAIPAAKKDGDKLVPGTASVEVVPDSDAVLSGSTDGEKLTIPGLAGSPKADLFYGTLAKPAAPSTAPAPAAGDPAHRVVTQADENNASNQINQILISSFKAKLMAQYPENLTIIDGAIAVTDKKLTVNKEVDSSGNFNIVGQANLRGLAFSPADLKILMLARAAQDKSITYPVEFRNYDVQYSNVQPDLANGKLSFTVTVKGTLVGKVSEDEVRSQVAGKSRTEAGTWISGKEEFSEGTVSISPFWRFGIPAESDKVRIQIK